MTSISSSPPTASHNTADSVLTAEQRGIIFAKAADVAPTLILICRKSDFGILYFNGTARQWLDPEGQTDLRDLTLLDFVGVGSINQLQNEMTLQTSLLGKWCGPCALRDIWGSEFSANIALTVHSAPAGSRDTLLCLQATRTSAITSDDASVASDQELLHALMETVPDAVYFKDRHSRFIRVSRSLANKDGVDNPAKFVGLTDFDRFTPEHAQPAYDDEQKIMLTGTPVIDLEEKETWPDGRITWVSSTKIPLRDASGRIVGTFGVSRDITLRKQAEQQHRELLIQLQLAQKLESIGRLAAGIAHEINTPTQFITDNAHFLTNTFSDLTKVLEAARTLRDAAKNEPALAASAEQFTSIEQAVELNYLLTEIPSTLKQSLDGLGRVARIVRSLKEFSHPSNAHRGATDLNRVIATAITVSRHEWKYVAEVVTDLSPDLPPVPCVVDEFNQVILNLLVNAAHAIESAQQQKNTPGNQGTITVRTRLDGKWALVEIEDTGTGIPDEIRERIFDPFFTTKPVGKGTGQGLTIVQNVIVKNHHGTIDVTSAIGRGTVFHIRLPLAVEPI